MTDEDFSALPTWKQRFLAPGISFPDWSSDRPERGVAICNASGVRQVWGLDLSTGKRWQLTDESVGVTEAHIRPDGSEVVWWWDDTGDERGGWMATPWEGGGSRRLLPDVEDGWNDGIDEVHGGVVVALSHSDHDCRIYLQRDDGPATMIYRSEEAAGIGHDYLGGGGLSADAALVCIRHSENGDSLAPGIRVIDTATTTTVAELHEPPVGFQATSWSPAKGDERLAVVHDRSGWPRPAVWQPREGTLADVQLSAPGEALIVDWWPDGSAVLVAVRHEMRTALYRCDLEEGTETLIADPGGEITSAAVRPDGTVWMQHSSGVSSPRTIDQSGVDVMPPLVPARPAGRTLRTIFATNPAGDRIQGFVMVPDGSGPFPMVVYSHGGPTGDEDADRYDPEWLAYADAGYAVVTTNYRGSEGYGTVFRDSMRHTGEMGDRQTEDILTILDAMIDEGIADPDRLLFSGWSWGGFMGLYMAGRHPERNWRAVFAGVPAAELVSAHWESSPELQAYDRAIMGGTPDDVPEVFAQANPYTYVGDVRAPVLIIAGDNDIRCTIGQVLRWTEAFEEAGGDLDLYRFATGHGSNASEETVDQVERVLRFFALHLAE